MLKYLQLPFLELFKLQYSVGRLQRFLFPISCTYKAVTSCPTQHRIMTYHDALCGVQSAYKNLAARRYMAPTSAHYNQFINITHS